ncbi:disulfide bond formation protein B [Pseudoalteromonas rubra]|uniref:Disulfide bond formation protein B n=1 Tax=Pseudoalteromonas rubra TaxID=43658 RepID=A0A0U3GZE0_9GAMM|nr:disulfide bond formation protein B [Pseudoalteromonas rubra]ALU45710.1 hypothetical protein AT705_22515 [Pseudoalteromonas rubra]
MLFELETYTRHAKWLGLVAIGVSILAWTVELMGVVYVCPYCRVQRTVIGLLGLMLFTGAGRHWMGKYAAMVMGFFGAVVAANQHFMGWKKISAGKFEFHETLIVDPFLLSGFAMTAIIGLVWLITRQQK